MRYRDTRRDVRLADLIVLATLLTSVSCDAPVETTLFVDLQTDLRLGVEVDRAEVFVYRGALPEGTAEAAATRVLTLDDDGRSGVRIALLERLGQGAHLVEVRLSGVVASDAVGRALVSLTGAHAVTVRVTRDCLDVVCPGDGSASQVACLGGRCVDPSCTPETPELCPESECRLDEECDVGAELPACARGVCLAGVCGAELTDDACGSGETCQPEGCVADAPDAGPLDAGPLDAGGLDAGLDAGGLDAGVGAVVVELAAGKAHTCAIDTDGQLWCWGENTDGQLGRGATSSSESVPGPSTFVVDPARALSLGGGHSCVRTTTNDAYCFGRNGSGQVGALASGAPVLEATPIASLAGQVLQIAAGEDHTCARTASNVFCWGRAGEGQLGSPGGETEIPRAVVGLGAVDGVVAGNLHTCARVAGSVSCWGANADGQIGDGTRTQRDVPTAVQGLVDAAQLVRGYDHTCAIRTNGRLACWGMSRGGLGNGVDLMARDVPTDTVDFGLATAGSGGSDHTCALADLVVRCWGSNARSQAGQDSPPMVRIEPGILTGLRSGSTAVAAGIEHTCALLSGDVHCWGGNYSGQLGDGTVDDRADVLRTLPLTR